MLGECGDNGLGRHADIETDETVQRDDAGTSHKEWGTLREPRETSDMDVVLVTNERRADRRHRRMSQALGNMSMDSRDCIGGGKKPTYTGCKQTATVNCHGAR